MAYALPKGMLLGACLLTATLLLSACQMSPSGVNSGPVPAHLVASQTNSACIAQMQQAALRASGHPVVLTPAAFATDDHLDIVAADPLDAKGLPSSGRLRGVPESYRLTLSAGRCVMTHPRSGQAAVLDACTCVAMQ
jgi:starvation-inducible outer membrane lipoprotein